MGEVIWVDFRRTNQFTRDGYLGAAERTEALAEVEGGRTGETLKRLARQYRRKAGQKI